MRKRVLWRYTPSPSQEIFIRQQAKVEGRELSRMIHKLVDEAILARQVAAAQAEKVTALTALLRGETTAPAGQQ
jgi:hypothetical protein